MSDNFWDVAYIKRTYHNCCQKIYANISKLFVRKLVSDSLKDKVPALQRQAVKVMPLQKCLVSQVGLCSDDITTGNFFNQVNAKIKSAPRVLTFCQNQLKYPTLFY